MPRKKKEDHANHERWLVSYADFITLLFAFFVVMYAISQADMAKLKQAAESIRTAFGAAGPAGMIDFSGTSGGATINPFDAVRVSGGRAMNLPAGKTHTASDPESDIQNLKELLEETISLDVGVSELTDRLMPVYDSKGLIIRLAVRDVFPKNSAALPGDIVPLIDRIGKALSKSPLVFRVEGHADASEANPPGYNSSWELSAARATAIARRLMDRFQMEPRQLGVAGYGHYRPLERSQSGWAAGSNRRFEIIVTRDRVVR